MGAPGPAYTKSLAETGDACARLFCPAPRAAQPPLGSAFTRIARPAGTRAPCAGRSGNLRNLQFHRPRRGGEWIQGRRRRRLSGDVLAPDDVDHEADDGDVHHEHSELEKAKAFCDLEGF